MARFRFPLESLLTARRLAERERQRGVADLERQRMRLEQKLRRMQDAIAGGRQDLRTALVGTLDAQSLRMHAASSLHHLRAAQRVVLELAGVQRNLDAARAALIEAARARRAIELLRDRRLEQWKTAQNKAETDMLDELAVIAAARRTGTDHGSTHSGGERR
jgi:flagellar FliJ protein